MAYQFHYTPTGTGVISGKEVLEQTEDAINDLSGQISGDVQTAIDTANNALNTANTASADAQNAVNTASTAYTAATNAQNTANTAQNTASNALTAAQNAQNDVNALGNRVTTAEGNITQNTNAITGLTTRMGTAEGNIGNLQTAVSTAQATANSAQQTATTARQQSYVFRYSSTALVASSTNSNTLLDNTDNLKVGDKVIDSSGVLFSITAIDSQNSTFTIGTALIDLAQDSDVVHKNGNETISGNKTFSTTIGSTAYPNIRMYLFDDEWNVQPASNKQSEIRFTDKNSVVVSYFAFQHRPDSAEPFRTCWRQHRLDGTPNYYSVDFNNLGEFYPENNNAINLGKSSNRWSDVQTYKVNSVEPSSLSLPSGNASDVIDISSYITALDGTSNSYTVPANGWISIAITGTAIAIVSSSWSDSRLRASSGNVRMLYPVLKNQTLDISVIGTTLDYARFIPCQGNV